MLVAIYLIISKPTHALTRYEFIVVNGQTTNSEFLEVV